jgi:hypothetical protein
MVGVVRGARRSRVSTDRSVKKGSPSSRPQGVC